MSSQPVLGASQAVDTPYPDSPWVVLKFGGRSVSTADNWAIVAKLIRERLDEGVRPVVVHSALVTETVQVTELYGTPSRTSTAKSRTGKPQARRAAPTSRTPCMPPVVTISCRRCCRGVQLDRGEWWRMVIEGLRVVHCGGCPSQASVVRGELARRRPGSADARHYHYVESEGDPHGNDHSARHISATMWSPPTVEW